LLSSISVIKDSTISLYSFFSLQSCSSSPSGFEVFVLSLEVVVEEEKEAVPTLEFFLMTGVTEDFF
jgi:hypothetical protein